MKKYLADILTLTRFVLAIVLFVLIFTDGSLAAAFLVFIVGELTDAFDGTCATKWPFPKGKAPKYRKYAAKYDMLTDMLLGAAMMVFFTARVSLIAGLILWVTYGIFGITIELIVYGKFLGHPDDFRPGSLFSRNFNLAKKLVMARRKVYLSIIAFVSAWTVYASEWSITAKIIITIVAIIVSVFLWFFLAQRRHNISRDAVNIEQKLSQKSSRR